MIEILDQLDVLARPELDLSALSLSGVPFGAPASALPCDRIAHVTVAHGSYGAVRRHDTRDRITDGVVHLVDKVSFKVTQGIVVGFTLYGEDHLIHVARIDTYEEFLVRFGTPDRIEKCEAFGALRGYRNYYWRSAKQAYWENGSGRLALLSLGRYEGNAGPGFDLAQSRRASNQWPDTLG
jgi:hypothetical protein